MSTQVLRWPLQLQPHGVFAPDTTHQTGIRLATVIDKQTRLGIPQQGLSTALLEQGNLTQLEERTLMMATLTKDLALFLPTSTILSVDINVPPNSRTVTIIVLYRPLTDFQTQYQFTWSAKI